MTELCTFPEANYALTLTKTSTWRAQRDVVQLFCTFASAQGALAGEIECSDRDLASHLHRGFRSCNAAAELLDALVGRDVLEREMVGTGRAESVYTIRHWSRWSVPWKFRRETIEDRVSAFVATEIRALGSVSARITVRAPAKSARAFSQELDELARGSMDPRAGRDLARGSTLVGASQSARYGNRRAAPLYSSRDLDLSPSLGSEGVRDDQQRSDLATALIAAVEASTGNPVYGKLRDEVAEIADSCNGTWASVLGVANRNTGPIITEKIRRLREAAAAPPPAPREADPPPAPALTPEELEASQEAAAAFFTTRAGQTPR